MVSKRLVWADSLKGGLIMLVVLGHAIQYTIGDGCYTNHLWNVIYSFHMSAFMAVSGYLAYRPQIFEQGLFLRSIWRRFRQLVVPFILWTLLWLSLGKCLNINTIVEFLLYPDKGLWFLWALFVINILMLVGNEIAEKWRLKQEMVIGVICMALCAFMILFDIRLLGFQFVAFYSLFYSIGYFMHKYEENIITKNKFLIIVIVLLWGGGAWFWQMHDLPIFLRELPLPEALTLYAYRLFVALIAIYALFTLSPNMLNVNYVWNKPFVMLGKVSLGIYTTHMLLMVMIVDVFREMGWSTECVIVSAFVTAAVVSCSLVLILKKWKITNQLLLGKI